MFKNIFNTTITRLLIAFISFIIVMLNAQFLGSELVGVISLIILNITIVLLFSNIFGGPALVYLTPRYRLMYLLLPAYIWVLFTSFCALVVVYFVVYVFNNPYELIPVSFEYHIVVLAFIHSVVTIHLNIILGKERIGLFNIINVLQIFVLIGVLCIFYFYKQYFDVLAYVYALYIAYGVSFFISSIFIIKQFIFVLQQPGGIKGLNLFELRKSIKAIIHFGLYAQLGNIIQLINYRIGYFFIQIFTSKSVLGVYSVGVQISEGVWILPKSISVVQFSRLSNAKNLDYARRLTIQLIKLVLIAVSIIVLLLLIFPLQFYIFLFGNEFHEIKIVIATLGIGILMLSISMIFSHYFSGIGKLKYNVVSSAIGAVFTVIFGLLLIPRYGLIGAGFSASLSYTASMLYQMIIFIKKNNLKQSDLKLTKQDIQFIFSEIKKITYIKK